MSYFDYPRIHFSGRFKASPSTINNTPNNFDPTHYPSPNELQKVELYWNPRGDGGFALVDCIITRVDYADGTSSVDSRGDPIVGQPLMSTKSAAFPLAAGLVDLDPMQQNVSEIWGMTVQIGGASPQPNLIGNFTAVSFAGIWGQAQGPKAPHSSSSGSAFYQSTLTNLQLNGEPGASRFLRYFAENPAAKCSINFDVNTHNNASPIFSFNKDTFDAMRAAQPPVPESVLTKIKPMQQLVQNLQADGKPRKGSPRGDVPAQDFVLFMLKQYLSTAEFNANIDTIVEKTQQTYVGSTTEAFLFGLVTGTVGPALDDAATFFVPSRMMNPPSSVKTVFNAPFVLSDDGKTIQLNLGNSLCTDLPGTTPWADTLGELSLVAFPGGEISKANARKLVEIPYTEKDFITGRAGVFTAALGTDCSQTPLGVISTTRQEEEVIILLAEQSDGYYLRADQFVFRMNPGISTTADFPRGETATARIHALKFGQPVADGTKVVVTMMTEEQAKTYTIRTMGTGGTLGIKKQNLSVPQDALKINGQNSPATASTLGGVATFELSCTPPGNPRGYVDGQIYFLNYGFADPNFSKEYVQDANDILSIQVYDQSVEMEAADILNKWGRLYKIMNFLTDDGKVEQIDRRNMIKLLLEKPFTELEHMPVTRDLGEAARKKIVDWIDELNNS